MAKVFIGLPSGPNVPIPLMNSYPEAVELGSKDKLRFYNIRGTNTVTARNSCVHEMLQGDWTHLFFMDSDMVFPKGTLKKLLKHDKDIVGGFYVIKRNDFHPTVFALGQRPGGKYLTEWVNDFREVEAIATGCLLIKREVLEKIPAPWFEYVWDEEAKGKMVTEDIIFCEKAKDIGYKVYCDGTIKCGHVGHFIITPTEDPGKNKIEPI